MSSDWLQTGKDILLVVGTIGGTWGGLRLSGRKNKTDAAQALFNDVQEERAELKNERAELKAEVAELKVQLEQLRADVRRRDIRDLMRDEFVQELRNHIRTGKPPPPPDWPEMLRNG